jgi:hypothetical protein
MWRIPQKAIQIYLSIYLSIYLQTRNFFIINIARAAFFLFRNQLYRSAELTGYEMQMNVS